MMKRLLSLIACTLAAIMMVSCSKDDPTDVINPYRIHVTTEAKAEADGSYLVSADGGTYTFEIDRGAPWLASVKETVHGKSILTNTEWGSRESLETSWVHASIAKDEGISKTLTVTIAPTDATEMRYIYVVVTNNVQSKTIAFKQLGLYNKP